jgi:SAM-dependent methyltransferase
VPGFSYYHDALSPARKPYGGNPARAAFLTTVVPWARAYPLSPMGQVASRRPLPSDRVPAAEFDAERFTAENVAFWTPLIIELAGIEAGQGLLDVGCGTGGFAAEIAEASGARVVGCDRSPAFLDYARRRSQTVHWVVADAAELPFASASFDRVLTSLVLHQLDDPARAVAEAHRILRPSGRLLVRTVLPDDAAARVPFRFLTALAEAQAALMPSMKDVARWIRAAGFTEVAKRRVCRNKRLETGAVEALLRKDAARRYTFLTQNEIEDGVRRLREAFARSPEPFVDLRPTWFFVAEKP